MYLPISLVIKRAPIQYALAYIYSEQDSYDATYFFDFHIRKIMQALDDFNEYVSRKILENNAYVTITSHATLNNISRQTAAKDIKQLENISLVSGVREGKYIKYRATQKLLELASHN